MLASGLQDRAPGGCSGSGNKLKRGHLRTQTNRSSS